MRKVGEEPATVAPAGERDAPVGESPAPSERLDVVTVAALQRTAGNRAVAAMLTSRSQRQLQRKPASTTFLTLPRGVEDVDFDDEAHTEAEVAATWAAIHTGGGVRVSSQRTVEIYKAHYRKKGVPETELAGVRPARWAYQDLLGLQRAMELARSIPAFAESAHGVFATKDVAGLVVGKLSGVITGASYVHASGDEAETVLTPGQTERAAIGLNVSCGQTEPPMDRDGNVLLPSASLTSTKFADQERARIDWEANNRRAVWVHELGHTIYPAYSGEWIADVRTPIRDDRYYARARKKYGEDRIPPTKGLEKLPTSYIVKKNRDEEDFAESLMVWTLFDHRHLSPLRLAFFATHPELNVQPPPATAVAPPAETPAAPRV